MKGSVATAILATILAWGGVSRGDEPVVVERLAPPPAMPFDISLSNQSPLALGLEGSSGRADSGPSPPAGPSSDASTSGDIRARFERQDQEIRNLQDQLKKLQQPDKDPADPKSAVKADDAKKLSGGDPLTDSGDGKKKDKDADAKKKDDKQAEWYEVGTDLKVNATFKNGLFLWLETPNKDFTMHLGAWMNWDNVWWNQSPGLTAPPDGRPGPAQGVATGVAEGGIGPLQDGEFFRRIRPFAEGTFWENGEYRLTVALENIQYTTTGLDEFWVGATNIPVVGTLRAGHVKDPVGLEADMTASSRCMTFMERSSYSEAIELNQNFVTGIWASNNYFDERMTWQAALFRTDLGASSGAFFGDGQYGWQCRLTGLPVYEDEGRQLLHLGISGGWRSGTNNLALSPLTVIQLRARPEMRDDVPAGSPSGAQNVPNADSNRMVDTGVIATGSDFLAGLEMLYIQGPFSAQAEYGWNWVDNATGVFSSYSSTATTFLPFATPQNYMFNGGYVQLAYTLTGENRAYDRRLGTLAREYYGKRGPLSNAFLVWDADGNLCSSWGAWEIAARYSYVNLNDGNGLNAIRGGAMQGLTVGLNWYLNNNLNVMMDWAHNYRYDLPIGTTPGYTDGFGMRVQFQF